MITKAIEGDIVKHNQTGRTSIVREVRDFGQWFIVRDNDKSAERWGLNGWMTNAVTLVFSAN